MQNQLANFYLEDKFILGHLQVTLHVKKGRQPHG